jgi:hypothetical protein
MSDRSQLEQEIATRAAEDEALKNALRSDSKAALRQYFNVNVPDNITVQVVEEDATTKYLVLRDNRGVAGQADVAIREERTIAYARNESVSGNEVVDRKVISIPDNWDYEGDDWHITTANPQDEGERRWRRAKGVTRHANGRVLSVWVEVAAGTKDSYGPNIWIGVELVVRMRPR